ncbi:hypothetical protein ACIOD2_25770 [Amycolatopsis sp. NPDC088138]|uniref:hypothetical protein n=1 Tax=Amycolatopsis sp. NPDC088138 TaxID=3363938 RepID=UPI00380C8F92
MTEVLDTPGLADELAIVTALTRLTPDRQRLFRQSCHKESMRSTDCAAEALVWEAFSVVGQEEGKVMRSLARRYSLKPEDLHRIRAMLDGAAMSWFDMSSDMWLVWLACRAVVNSELKHRQTLELAQPPLPPAPPVVKKSKPRARRKSAARRDQPAPVKPVTRQEAVMAMLRQYPEGVATRTVTEELGGRPAREVLRRLRQAGQVETRDGLNFAVAASGIPTVDVRQSA